MAYPKHINLIRKVLEEHKAEEIQIINVKERSPFFTYYVIATCLNERQLNALSDEVEEKLEENGFDVKKKDGKPTSGWMIIDAGDTLVHLFTNSKRLEVGLEDLLKKEETKKA